MPTTIIVPAYNSTADLAECLHAIKVAALPDTDIIVVDDASIDGTAQVAALMGVLALKLPTNSGPAAARNRGADHARNEIVFFVDADVALAPDAVARVEKTFKDNPELGAVFGSYDASPKSPGVISQYRNLLHHFVHQNGRSEAATFWAGCGAIRRSVFGMIGGFNESRFPQPSIEDIELGYRLRQAGYRILLDRDLQGKHLKRWSFWSLIQTDITRRAIPWSRLILETKNLPNDLNLKTRERISAALLISACVFLLFSPARPKLIVAAAAALFGTTILNRQLYSFFLRQRGTSFAAAAIALHWLYYLYSGASYFYVWCDVRLKSFGRSLDSASESRRRARTS